MYFSHSAFGETPISEHSRVIVIEPRSAFSSFTATYRLPAGLGLRRLDADARSTFQQSHIVSVPQDPLRLLSIPKELKNEVQILKETKRDVMINKEPKREIRIPQDLTRNTRVQARTHIAPINIPQDFPRIVVVGLQNKRIAYVNKEALRNLRVTKDPARLINIIEDISRTVKVTGQWH